MRGAARKGGPYREGTPTGNGEKQIGRAYGAPRQPSALPPVPRRLVSVNFENASRTRAFGFVRVFGYDEGKQAQAFWAKERMSPPLLSFSITLGLRHGFSVGRNDS